MPAYDGERKVTQDSGCQTGGILEWMLGRDIDDRNFREKEPPFEIDWLEKVPDFETHGDTIKTVPVEHGTVLRILPIGCKMERGIPGRLLGLQAIEFHPDEIIDPELFSPGAMRSNPDSRARPDRCVSAMGVVETVFAHAPVDPDEIGWCLISRHLQTSREKSTQWTWLANRPDAWSSRLRQPPRLGSNTGEGDPRGNCMAVEGQPR